MGKAKINVSLMAVTDASMAVAEEQVTFSRDMLTWNKDKDVQYVHNSEPNSAYFAVLEGGMTSGPCRLMLLKDAEYGFYQICTAYGHYLYPVAFYGRMVKTDEKGVGEYNKKMAQIWKRLTGKSID